MQTSYIFSPVIRILMEKARLMLIYSPFN